MRYYVLASGSKGNSTIIETKNHRLLQIDMGVTLKYEKEKLLEFGLNFESIEALLLTHDHTDHIKCANMFDVKKIFCAEGTYTIPKENLLKPYCTYEIASLSITVLATSHDAKNPIGFIIEEDNEKLVYMTDTGYISEKNLKYMQNADFILIESNHNVKMLFETNRPAYLIMRILGDEGHLSNDDSAMYISEIIGSNTKEITLLHLSEEANTHELALSTYRRILQSRCGDISNIILQAASQREALSGGYKKVSI